MERRTRRSMNGNDKMNILSLFIKGKKSMAELCDEHKLQPTQVYKWQEELLNRGAEIFDNPEGKKNAALATKREQELQRKLEGKTEVILEIMEELVKTKKKLGLN
jgi:transposase